MGVSRATLSLVASLFFIVNILFGVNDFLIILGMPINEHLAFASGELIFFFKTSPLKEIIIKSNEKKKES